jgi:hypothetical protein
MNRIQKLQALITDRFNGSKAAFARAIGKAPSQVSQRLSGHRDVGDAWARHIEIALNLEQGHFDATPRRVEQTTVPYEAKVIAIPDRQDPLIDEAVKLLERTDATGKQIALGAIRVALHGYKPVKSNRAS